MIHFIVNNASNNGKSKIDWIVLEKLLNENKLVYKISFCNRLQPVSKILSENINKNDIVVAVGGDGTINAIINEIMHKKLDVFFTVLPDGTGNDWVKTHQINNNLSALIQRLKQDKVFHHDIGKIEYGEQFEKVFYFINMLGIGYSGKVVKVLDENLKILQNKFKYTLASLIALKSLKNFNTTIVIDGKDLKTNLTELNISICKYGGGGMKFAPFASGNSNFFHVAIVSNFNAIKFILNTQKLFSGEYIKHKDVETYNAKTIEIKHTKMYMQADGELLGNSPAKISILPNHLKVLT